MQSQVQPESAPLLLRSQTLTGKWRPPAAAPRPIAGGGRRGALWRANLRVPAPVTAGPRGDGRSGRGAAPNIIFNFSASRAQKGEPALFEPWTGHTADLVGHKHPQ